MPLITKSRTCHTCNSPVPWTRLWLQASFWSRWPCPGCGTELGFDVRRRIIVTLVASPLIGFGLGFLARGEPWLGLICIPLGIFVWSFDAVVVKSDAGRSTE